MSDKTFYVKVAEIQRSLNAPKSQIVKNRNGGVLYRYRNAEDIFEGLKLVQGDLVIKTSTDFYEMAGAVWCKATAMVTDGEKELVAFSNVEHPRSRPNMDAGQSAGATQSYAVKYALGSLFAIDDSKIEPSPDVDSQEFKDMTAIKTTINTQSNVVQKSQGQRKTIEPTEKQKSFYKKLLAEKYKSPANVPKDEIEKALAMDIAAMKAAIDQLCKELGK